MRGMRNGNVACTHAVSKRASYRLSCIAVTGVKCSNRVTSSPAFEPGLAEGDTSAFVTGLLRIFQ